MKMGARIRGCMRIAAILLSAATAQAQFESNNVSLYANLPLSRFGNASNGNSCWGYTSPSGREYAIMGVSNQAAFVEITNPSNPVIVQMVPHTNSLWADMKVYRNYCYVVNESGGGVQIIDMANIDNGSVRLVGSFGPATSHTVALNEKSGFLYTAGASSDQGIGCWDLSNPEAPVKRGQWNDRYCHETHVVTYESGTYAGKEIAFCCNGGAGIEILDVTNKASIALLSTTTYPGLSYCHQGWTSDDRRYLYVDDELDEQRGRTPTTRTLIFDILNLSAPVLVGTFTTGLPSVDHNLYYRDGFIYESNYTSGLRIFDASNPLKPVETGYFDTFPGSNAAEFSGDWSNYPFFPSGTVIMGDLDRGLFIVDVSKAIRGLRFNFPNGLPELASPAGNTTIRVEVTGRGGSVPDPGTGKLFYDLGQGFIEKNMTEVSPNIYDAVLPGGSCGASIKYYFSAKTTTGEVSTSPSDAPTSSHSALFADSLIVAFEDNFQTDKGWTVTNTALTDGAWERGVPVGAGDRGDPTKDYDGSGACYLTANRAGNSDVDGGPTTLTSPKFDMTTGGKIEVALWLSTDNDLMQVQISNDDGATWASLQTLTGTQGWELKTYEPGKVLPTTNAMRFRVSVADNPNDSVTEAAVDAFKVSTPVCGGEVTCDDVKKFKANCKSGGQVKATLTLKSGAFDGKTVTLALNGQNFDVVIKGKKASLKNCCYAGTVTADLVKPSGCPGGSKTTQCP